MYKDNEILVTVKPVFVKGEELPIGTEVEFVKAIDNDDLTLAMVYIKHGDQLFLTKEINVKPKDKKTLDKGFKDTQKYLMRNNPRLRRHHYNFLLKVYFRIYYFFADLFGGKSE